MGNKFEVYSYVRDTDCSQYYYKEVYHGEDMEEALRIAFAEKQKGVGCVKIEWR